MVTDPDPAKFKQTLDDLAEQVNHVIEHNGPGPVPGKLGIFLPVETWLDIIVAARIGAP